jgi:hypothetical protein
VAELEIRVLTDDGQPLQAYTLDPTCDYNHPVVGREVTEAGLDGQPNMCSN